MAAVEHRGRVMASLLQLVVVDPPPGAVDDTIAALDRLEQCWSRFIGGSDISRLNRAGGKPVAVAPETVVLVSTMVDAWTMTAGRFDPTVLPTLVANGYAASLADPTRRTVLSGRPRSGAMGEVVVDLHHVTLPLGVSLDPGGIGKGLAADLAVARLLALGARGALVNIGGDLAVGGQAPDGDGWVVTIERPDPAEADLGSIALDAGGVATSSTVSRRWVHDGRVRHHLIDPFAAAEAVTDLASVTVVAGSGWVAEAHAKAALLTGAAGVLRYLAGHGLSGVAVAHDGTVLTTSDLDALGNPALAATGGVR